jgi:hypothetical protein
MPEKSKAHKDKTMHDINRTIKLNLLTRNIPKEGAMTIASPGASMK